MSSRARNANSSRPTPGVYYLNFHQLRLVLQNSIPRADVLHKTVSFVTRVKLDGKMFVGLPDQKLRDLACHDPLMLGQFQVLRTAPTHEIQSLLATGSGKSAEPTIESEEQPFDRQRSQDEESSDESHPALHGHNDDERPASPTILTSDTSISITADEFAGVNTVDINLSTPMDATQVVDDVPSPNPESTILDTGTPPDGALVLEPVEVGIVSPLEIPLPTDDSDLDLLDVEENEHDEALSDDEVIGPDLESIGLTSIDDAGGDETQARSTATQEIGGMHVWSGNGNGQEESQSESISPFVTCDSRLEDLLLTTEPLSSVDEVGDIETDTTKQPDPASCQITSADVDDLESEDRNAEHRLQDDDATSSPTSLLVVCNETRALVSALDTEVDIPTSSGSSTVQGEISAASETRDSAEEFTDLPRVSEQPPFAKSEHATSGVEERGRAPDADGDSATSPPTVEDAQPDIEPENLQSKIEGLQPDWIEPLSSNSEPHVAQDSSESAADVAANGVLQTTEELDDTTFDDSSTLIEDLADWTKDGHIPMPDDFSLAKLSIVTDISNSGSPSSSDRSLFTVSPTFSKSFPDSDVFLSSPTNIQVDGGHLFFCDGAYDDYMSSTPVNDVQFPLLPYKFPRFEEIDSADDFSVPVADEYSLVDHPPPTYDFSELPFHVSSSYDMDADSSSNIHSIDLLDEPVPEISIGVGCESPGVHEPTYLPFLAQTVEAGPPSTTLDNGTPEIPIPSDLSLNEEQASDEEFDAVYEDVGPEGESSDETDSTSVEPTRFRGLPPLDTNVPSLMDDAEISAFLSPEASNSYKSIIHTPINFPSSSASPRSLFPFSDSPTSEKKIEAYTKRVSNSASFRLRSSQPARIGEPTSSEVLDEQLGMSDIFASVLATPISALSNFFRLV